MQKKRNAFSLIELSIVILILAILIGGISQASKLIYSYRLYHARSFTQSGPVTTIPDLVFWLDSSADGVFLNQNGSAEMSTNDTISSWKEPNYLTRERKSCTEATQANQPSYIPKGIGNLPVVRFKSNASTDMKLSCTIMGGVNSENTIFIVSNWTSSYSGANTNSIVIGNDPVTLTGITTGGVLNFYGYTSSGGGVVDQLHYTLTAGVNFIMTRWNNNSMNSSILYVNGTSVDSSTSALSGTYTSAATDTPITLGNYPGAPRPLGGDIAEIIIYDRPLNNEERKAIEKYLSKKWGIKVS